MCKQSFCIFFATQERLIPELFIFFKLATQEPYNFSFIEAPNKFMKYSLFCVCPFFVHLMYFKFSGRRESSGFVKFLKRYSQSGSEVLQLRLG